MNKYLTKYLLLAMMASPLMRAYGPDMYQLDQEFNTMIDEVVAPEEIRQEADLRAELTRNPNEGQFGETSEDLSTGNSDVIAGDDADVRYAEVLTEGQKQAEAEALEAARQRGLYSPEGMVEPKPYEVREDALVTKTEALKEVAQQERLEKANLSQNIQTTTSQVVQEQSQDALIQESYHRDYENMLSERNHDQMNYFRTLPQAKDAEVLTDTQPLSSIDSIVESIKNPSLPEQSDVYNAIKQEFPDGHETVAVTDPVIARASQQDHLEMNSFRAISDVQGEDVVRNRTVEMLPCSEVCDLATAVKASDVDQINFGSVMRQEFPYDMPNIIPVGVVDPVINQINTTYVVDGMSHLVSGAVEAAETVREAAEGMSNLTDFVNMNPFKLYGRQAYNTLESSCSDAYNFARGFLYFKGTDALKVARAGITVAKENPKQAAQMVLGLAKEHPVATGIAVATAAAATYGTYKFVAAKVKSRRAAKKKAADEQRKANLLQAMRNPSVANEFTGLAKQLIGFTNNELCLALNWGGSTESAQEILNTLFDAYQDQITFILGIDWSKETTGDSVIVLHNFCQNVAKLMELSIEYRNANSALKEQQAVCQKLQQQKSARAKAAQQDWSWAAYGF